MQAQQHRSAIRQSWGMALSKLSLPIHLKFVLAQPIDSALADAHALLQVCCVHSSKDLDMLLCPQSKQHSAHLHANRMRYGIRIFCLCEMRSCTRISHRRLSTSCAMHLWQLQGDSSQVRINMLLPHCMPASCSFVLHSVIGSQVVCCMYLQQSHKATLYLFSTIR